MARKTAWNFAENKIDVLDENISKEDLLKNVALYIGYNADYHHDGFQNVAQYDVIDWDILVDRLHELKIIIKEQEHSFLKMFEEYKVLPKIVKLLKEAELDVLKYNLDYTWEYKNGEVTLKRLRKTEVL